ncbi:MAG TPA: glycosyltransferase family 9 protein [Bacteroidia bacterium]
MRIKLPSSEQLLYAANALFNRLFFKQGYAPKIQSVLVVKWDEIGDMATATHVFKALRSSYPNVHLTVLCKPFVKNLIQYDPNIDEIITEIRDFNKKFDAVIELRGTFETLKKAIRYGVKYRCGRAEVRLKNKGKQLHELQTNFQSVLPLLKPEIIEERPVLYFSENDSRIVEQFIHQRNIKKFAIIHAGARRKLRQWEPLKFRKIVEYLHAKYNLDIVFAGANEDLATIQTIAEGLEFATYDFIGDYTLSQFSCLCSKAQFYVGNESGPLHIASAFNVPLVALYGPGVPDVFYPSSDKRAVLHHVLECNPCDQIHCVHPDNPCISRIQVHDVICKIDEILIF